MIVVGGLSLILYRLISNPNQLSSVGIDPSTTKTFLQIFSTIFFGLLTFLGIGLLVVNLYRLITVKNVSKLKFSFGAVGGFLLFIIALALGAQVITSVRNISIENIVDSNQVIMPYVQLKEGFVYTRGDATLKLIAPTSLAYKLNTTYFNAQILPTLGQVTISAMNLDCGNGQTLSYDMTNPQFVGTCIYFHKGSYPLNLEVDYLNIPTGEKLKKYFSGGNMDINTEISITTNKGAVQVDPKTGISVGKVPSKVSFDASTAFKDLNLGDYKILRDFDGDGQWDKQDQSTVTYVYKEAKVYMVNIRFPMLNSHIYTFPIRVEQSDVPVCEVDIQTGTAPNYAFHTAFLDPNVTISEYQFDIIDTAHKNAVVDTIKAKSPDFNYQFPGKGQYAIQANFITDGGKQGQCESDDILIGNSSFDIAYDLAYKSPNTPQFQKVGTDGDVISQSGSLLVKVIPSVIQVKITKVTPTTAGLTKKVLLDGKQILSSDGATFEATIQDSKDHEISIVVEDASRGATSQETIPITTKRDDIVGKILVKPDTVGTDPFTVKFDASTTTVNDPTDEIVYFSWDFGDGVVKKNLSEAIITHTYTYDTTKENGVYMPVLTIQTKKGRKITISPENNIIVKKATKTLIIHIDSNPAQIANVDDRVSFSLEVNGLPNTIHRDFGNGKTLDCQARECIQATQIYTTPGTYTIKAEVTYASQPTIDGSITLKIK